VSVLKTKMVRSGAGDGASSGAAGGASSGAAGGASSNAAIQLTLALSLSLVLLSSCSKTADKTETTKTTTPTTTTTTTSTSASDSNGASKPGKEEPALQDGLLPQIEAARKKIKLGAMPDSEVICTVAGTPITIGQYRRTLLTEEEQVQTNLTADPNAQQEFIEEGKREGIALTADEKKRLLETAKKAETAGDGAVKKHLDSVHETTAHFNEYVLNLGEAFKVATSKIEEHLLHQMVDRELLCGAGRAKGYGASAVNVFIEAKKNKAFDKMLKSGYTEDQLRDDIVQGELVKKMLDYIHKTARVSDSDIQQFYDKNKDRFTHGELVQLSQIVIAAPAKDSPQQPSMRTQIKQQDPKISAADLDQKVKVVEQQQKQKAADILARALKGEDFAKLADETSDDIASRAAKTGGNMGMQEKSHMLKDFAKKVDSLKIGQVYPELIPSAYGYHIIKLVARKPAGAQPLAEVKNDLRQLLQAHAEQKALRDWLVDKRKSTEIKLSPEFQTLVTTDTSKTTTTDASKTKAQ
jgi:parvulin-like peptidyl-prolyl isomerase